MKYYSELKFEVNIQRAYCTFEIEETRRKMGWATMTVLYFSNIPKAFTVYRMALPLTGL